MNSRFLLVSLLFSVVVFSSACSSDEGEKGGEGGAGGERNGGGDIGAPCEVEEHCASGLICDIHDGRGSCQDDSHDH